MRRETFPVTGPVALVVRAPAGMVEIEAVDTSEAVVELRAERNGADGAIEGALVELRPGSDRPELFVDVQQGFRIGNRKGFSLSIVFGGGPAVRAAIRVPTGSSVEVESDAADVTGTGRFDRAEVKTAAGDVRLDEVEGDVRVKCVAGDVTLGSIGGEAHINSVSGDATIGRVCGRRRAAVRLRRHRPPRSGWLGPREDDLRRRARRRGDEGSGGDAVRLR